MKELITIAVDAMGGDNSPRKVIEGIELHHKKSKNIFYKLFGDKNLIDPIIKNKSIDSNFIEIIHTEEKIKGEDTAFAAAFRSPHALHTIHNVSDGVYRSWSHAHSSFDPIWATPVPSCTLRSCE